MKFYGITVVFDDKTYFIKWVSLVRIDTTVDASDARVWNTRDEVESAIGTVNDWNGAASSSEIIDMEDILKDLIGLKQMKSILSNCKSEI